MKILQVHNEYQYFGGEEAVVESEYSLLTKNDHQVHQWIISNNQIKETHPLAKARLAINSVWSIDSYRDMQDHLADFKPDVVHIHNTIPLLTPSIYKACSDMSIPTVQTLHNFKFICPGSNLYRDGKVCEDCVGKPFTYPALLHGCYRRDYPSTFATVAGLTFNRLAGTYENITSFIALTEFARKKFIEGGLNGNKIFVKPNFLAQQVNVGSHDGKFILFAGRLLPQKGIETLLKAWQLLDIDIPLKIVGRGPLASLISEYSLPNVEYLGTVERNQLMKIMQDATLLVFPSEWYEGFPMILVEALAAGLPVVASRLGGMAEIVNEGKTGWLFEPGNPDSLAKVVRLAMLNNGELKLRSKAARQECESIYSSGRNYQLLIDIYQSAINQTKN